MVNVCFEKYSLVCQINARGVEIKENWITIIWFYITVFCDFTKSCQNIWPRKLIPEKFGRKKSCGENHHRKFLPSKFQNFCFLTFVQGRGVSKKGCVSGGRVDEAKCILELFLKRCMYTVAIVLCTTNSPWLYSLISVIGEYVSQF